MDIEKLIKEITSNEDALAFTKSKGANIHEARAVTEQTMHDVFYVPSAYENSGIYIKIAKMGKNGPDKKEMEIEAAWYEALRSRLNIPGVPEAKTFQLNEDFALAVEEVQGLTYDHILKNLEKRGVNIKHSKELKKLMEKSAEITARGYALRGEVPTYFGDFNKEELEFLNRRSSKILNGNGIQIEDLEKLLTATVTPLTDERIWLLYRDATPLNWIDTPKGVVPIDLGSTSYRPPQFEAIALFETPNSGFNSLSEEERIELIFDYRRMLKDAGTTVERLGTMSDFFTNYCLASFVKNISGWASRKQHISDNLRDIEGDNQSKADIAKERLPKNREGATFHRRRALEALRNIKVYLKTYNLTTEYLRTENILNQD